MIKEYAEDAKKQWDERTIMTATEESAREERRKAVIDKVRLGCPNVWEVKMRRAKGGHVIVFPGVFSTKELAEKWADEQLKKYPVWANRVKSWSVNLKESRFVSDKCLLRMDMPDTRWTEITTSRWTSKFF